MNQQRISLSTCPSFLWGAIITLAIIDIIGLCIEGMSLDIKIFATYVLLSVAFVSMAILNNRLGAERWIIALLYVLGVSVACFFLTLIFSYLAVGWRQPLIDLPLVRADLFLCFDWMALYNWENERQPVHFFLQVVYASFFAQIILVQSVLVLRSQIKRNWEFLCLFIVSCIACIVPAFFWPVAGAFAYFHVELNTPYLHAIMALHDGTLKIIGSEPLQGVIQLPSFHAAMAVLNTYALRGIRGFFPAFAIVNVFMIISTLPIGGHYLVDVLSGIFVALATIAIVGRLAHQGLLDGRS